MFTDFHVNYIKHNNPPFQLLGIQQIQWVLHLLPGIFPPASKFPTAKKFTQETSVKVSIGTGGGDKATDGTWQELDSGIFRGRFLKPFGWLEDGIWPGFLCPDEIPEEKNLKKNSLLQISPTWPQPYDNGSKAKKTRKADSHKRSLTSKQVQSYAKHSGNTSRQQPHVSINLSC